VKDKIGIQTTNRNGIRYYIVSRKVKWPFIFFVIFMIWAGIELFLYIQRLEEAHAMAQYHQKILERQVMMLHKEIEARESAYARLGDRLNDLETLLGRKSNEPLPTSTRLERVTLSAAQLALLFSIVPNGAPLPMNGVTEAFGWRTHPIIKRREFHTGIDLRAKHQKPVWTTADGVVEYAGYHQKSGFGNLVIIDHGFGFKTYYGHLGKITVHMGDTVTKGDVIGLSGNTGLSTAPHLHYEIRFLTRPLNPYWFIKWRLENYTSIFKRERKVPWESLIALMNHIVTKTIPPSMQGGEQVRR